MVAEKSCSQEMSIYVVYMKNLRGISHSKFIPVQNTDDMHN